MRTIQELNFKRRDARERALTHSLTHTCNNSVGGLTVGSIFLQIDFNLLHSQPGVLVYTEVVQNFGRRFSVRIFHVAGLGFFYYLFFLFFLNLTDKVQIHVVELHLMKKIGKVVGGWAAEVVDVDEERR